MTVDDRNYTYSIGDSGILQTCFESSAKNNTTTTYQVSASFEGDELRSASAYVFLPNGTQYAVCITIQNEYKPAVNSTSLTPEPQATQAMQRAPSENRVMPR